MKNFKKCFAALGLAVVMVISVFAGNITARALDEYEGYGAEDYEWLQGFDLPFDVMSTVELARMVGGAPATLARDVYYQVGGGSNMAHVRHIQFRASDFGQGQHWALVTGGRVAAFLPVTGSTNRISTGWFPSGFSPVSFPSGIEWNTEVLFGGGSPIVSVGATSGRAISVDFFPGGGGGGSLRNGLVLVGVNTAAVDYATAVVSMPIWYRTRVNADQMWNWTEAHANWVANWADRNEPVTMTFTWFGRGTQAPIVLANRREPGDFNISYPADDVLTFSGGAINLPGQIRIAEQSVGSFTNYGGRPWMVRLTLDRGFSWGPSEREEMVKATFNQ